jgi:hypothetical protein
VSKPAYLKAPPCRSCKATVVTPIRPMGETTMTTDRWHGPSDATLWCPACGDGWRHDDPAEFHAADRAWRSWERKQDRDEVTAKRLRKAVATMEALKEYERRWGKA